MAPDPVSAASLEQRLLASTCGVPDCTACAITLEAADALAAQRAALETAKQTIRTWHGMGLPDVVEPEAWALYQASPEMQKINAALAASPAGER